MIDAPTHKIAGALFAPQAYLPGGWCNNVLLEWDAQGLLTAVRSDVGAHTLHGRTEVSRARGPVLPGMPNLHSHAFQSPMAGLTEYRGQASNSFWSWRELMYRYAARISPEALSAIAGQLYMDMLKAGYTSACEFHYLHHRPDGRPYADRNEMGLSLIDAAALTGLGMTFLPVLYQYSDFGARPPRPDQARFLNTPEQLLDMLVHLSGARPESPQRRYGAAPHSLRAVSKDSLSVLLSGMEQDFAGAPIHIHIAEQTAEVDVCMAVHGARPVQWLLDHYAVDSSWCLVHATHIDTNETRALAATGAVAGLCPTTEANLGDGIFPAAAYLDAGGQVGLGSDSHICVDWRSELRLLEYGQRLLHRQRNVLASEHRPFVADRLFAAATQGGAQAGGLANGLLQVGRRADCLVLDLEHPALAGRHSDHWLSGIVFSERGQTPIKDVYAAGRCVVRDGRHIDEAAITSRYLRVLAALPQ